MLYDVVLEIKIMKHKILAIILVFYIGCSNSQTPNISSSRWEIIPDVSDEFNGTVGDLATRWNISNYCEFHPSPSGTHLKFDPTEVTVATPTGTGATGKALKLWIHQIAPTSLGCSELINYKIGEIQSKKLTRYGYYEMNLKMPATGNNTGCNFWLNHARCPLDPYLANPIQYPTPPVNKDRYSEIDIFEMCAKNPTDIPIALHTGPTFNRNNNVNTCVGCIFNYNDGTPAGGSSSNGVNFSSVFHKVGINWQPSYIDWYIDDVFFKRFSNIPFTTLMFPDCPTFGPTLPISYLSGIPVVTLIGSGISNSYPGPFASAAGENFQVDYFRYYKFKPYLNNITFSGSTITLSVNTVPDDTYGWTDPNHITTSFIPNGNQCSLQMNSGTNGNISVIASQIEIQKTNSNQTASDFTYKSNSIFNLTYSNAAFNVCSVPTSNFIIVAYSITAPGTCIPSVILANQEAYFKSTGGGITLNNNFEVQMGATFTGE